MSNTDNTLRIVFFLLVCLSASNLALAQCEKHPPNIDCVSKGEHVWQWIIKQPSVHQRMTEYPFIRFHKGQTVTIEAQGAVYVDVEKRWIDFVHPENSFWGSSADRLYHGLIWIPGAAIRYEDKLLRVPLGTELVPIASAIGGPECRGRASCLPKFEIGDTPNSADQYLRLGYEAKPSEFKQERLGYASRGPHLKPATVTITVAETPERRDFASLLRPLDIISEEVDANGLLLSPRFAGTYPFPEEQISASSRCDNFPYGNPFKATNIRLKGSNGAADCTFQSSFDVPRQWNKYFFTTCLLEPAIGRLHGHVNWVPATFIGKLVMMRPGSTDSLETFSADGDWDLHLVELTDEERHARFGDFSAASPVATGASIGQNANAVNKQFGIEPALTSDSQGDGSPYQHSLQLEFSSLEVPHWLVPPDQQMRFAKSLGAAKTTAKELLARFANHTAVVIGLFGLDCVHECHTEIHPVFAIAVRERDDSTGAVAGPDTWLIFVRNFGGEGSCAQDWHFLERKTLTLTLPFPTNAADGSEITVGGDFISDVKGSWSTKPIPHERALLVTFTLSDDPSITPMRTRGSLTINSRGIQPNYREQHAYNVQQLDSQESQQILKDPVTKIKASKFSLKEYFHPVLGVVGDRIAFHDASLYLTGARVELLGTPLGSFEIEGSHTFPSQSRISATGTKFSLSATNLLYGLKLSLDSYLPNLFGELKGGYFWRSGKPNSGTTELFENFTGNAASIYLGGGYTFREPQFWSVRASGGIFFVPATSEHIWRFALASQFRLAKNHSH